MDLGLPTDSVLAPLRRSLVLASLFFAAALSAAPTQSPPLIPRRHFFASPERSRPMVSPDGKHLAYLAPHQGRSNIWVRTLGHADDKPLTAYQDHSIRWFEWRWDNHGLVFIRDDGGDEEWHIYSTGLNSEPRDITPAKVDGLGNFNLLPARPDEALVQMRSKDSNYHLFRLHLSSGHLTSLGVMPGSVWPDNAGRVRLAGGGRYGIEFQSRSSEEASWGRIFALNVDESFEGVEGFSKDDQQVFIAATFGDDTSGLWRVSLKDGSRQRVAVDPQFDFESALFDPVTREPELVSFMKQRLEWRPLTSQAAVDLQRLQAARFGDIRVLSRDANARLWTIMYLQDAAAPFYALYDRVAGSVQPLFSGNVELEGVELAQMRPVSFTARDGMRLFAYLSLPPRADGPLPLIVLPHGGPWARDRWGYDPEVQWLCNRGYAVLQVNFRGSKGFGRAYLRAGDGEWGGKMSSDLIDGKRWAIRQGVADAARCAIYGTSYGGYAALAALAFTPQEFVCGVDICGPSSLITLFGDIQERYGATVLSKRVGHLGSDSGFLRSRSPLNAVRQIQAPVFIAQGKNDPRVPRQESDQMVAALKDRGKEHRYVLFADEGHGFDKWEHQLALNEEVESFLAKHLGGRVEGADFGTTKNVADSGLYEKNLKINEMAAAMGKTSAYLVMADRYRDGHGVTRSAQRDFEWSLKAAQASDLQGMLRTGMAYGLGQGVTQSAQSSLYWLAKAAATGDAGAEATLGNAYRYGYYGFADVGKARQWLGMSLADKYGKAGWDFARMQALGVGQSVDEAGALRSLSQGAHLGDDWCMYELGRLARRGKAGALDKADAWRLFEQANGTEGWSDHYRAWMLQNGEAPRQDPALAEKLISAHSGAVGSWRWSGTPARIAQAPASVPLDGSLGAFRRVTPVAINGRDAAHAPYGPVKGPDSLAAHIRLMRDTRFLYIGCDVRQGRPPINQRYPGRLWDGDCVELLISSRSSLFSRKRERKSPFDFQFVFTPSSASGRPAYEAAQDVRGIQLTSKALPDGYSLVIAIPIEELDGLDWVSGSKTRFEVAVGKADANGKRYTKAFWNGKDDSAWDAPDLWGAAVVE